MKTIILTLHTGATLEIYIQDLSMVKRTTFPEPEGCLIYHKAKGTAIFCKDAMVFRTEKSDYVTESFDDLEKMVRNLLDAPTGELAEVNG